jgi:hypothetical protein
METRPPFVLRVKEEEEEEEAAAAAAEEEEDNNTYLLACVFRPVPTVLDGTSCNCYIVSHLPRTTSYSHQMLLCSLSGNR